MLPTFDEYAKILRELIERPKSRMLLKASDYPKNGKNGKSPKGAKRRKHAAFQLTSGAFISEFVTLWELFDHRDEFRTFIEMFAKKAAEIHEKQPFAAIVTSTSTSKHIVEHAHALIEKARGRVSLYYLGDYPLLDSENRDLLDFKGENVLIATDVVATGGLVAKMAEIVEEVGGHPIGVLCALLIEPDLIRDPVFTVVGKDSSDRPLKKLRINSLTTRPVQFRKENDGAPKPLITLIDPVTVLPVDNLLLPNGFHPCFSEAEMLAQLEAAQALDFDFYEADSRRLTTAVRVRVLLETHRDAIWQKIEKTVREGDTLVTTFQRDDVIFKDFVEDMLRPRKPDFVFSPRRGSLATANSYFLMPEELEKVKNKKIVVLLSSIHTSERLRNLASLLVSNGAKSLIVVCLLNRMGIYTSSFISRLERLVRGLGQIDDKPKKHARFEFLFLYSLPDVSDNDLKRMQETVRALFDYYMAQTRVPSFRRTLQQDYKYFQSKSLTSYEFERVRSHALSDVFEFAIGNGKHAHPITVSSREGKLALLCGRLAAERDFSPFIAAIRDFDLRDKDTLYKIFGVLLSDLSYLKMTGNFKRLRETLIDEIEKLRRQRLEIERQFHGDKSDLGQQIDSNIDTETHLLFGLALFSYLDYEYNYESFILKTMSCGLSPTDWEALPENFAHYYCNERMAWCLSTLLHFSHHDFRQPQVARGLKKSLEKVTDDLLQGLDLILSDGDQGLAATRQRVKTNLNQLQTELGLHELTENHQVIRFLQSRIIFVKRSHNPIDSSLDLALIELQRVLLDFNQPPSSNDSQARRRVHVKDDAVKKALEDAIHTAGVLEEIAEAVRQMLVFTPVSRKDAKRFGAEPALPGFAGDVKNLGDSFQRVRITNLVSKSDFVELKEIRTRIAFDLWDEDSFLRMLLLRYIVSLRESMDDALVYANSRLHSLGFGDVWEPTRSALPKLRLLDGKVLIEPQLLREVLRNIFSNVRHAFDGYQLSSGATYTDLVKLKIETTKRPAPGLKVEDRTYFKLTVTSRGAGWGGLREDATIHGHRKEIESFGGELKIYPLPKTHGTVVTLTLLARHGPPKSGMLFVDRREEATP